MIVRIPNIYPSWSLESPTFTPSWSLESPTFTPMIVRADGNMAEQALVGDTLQALPHHLLPPCQHEYKGSPPTHHPVQSKSFREFPPLFDLPTFSCPVSQPSLVQSPNFLLLGLFWLYLDLKDSLFSGGARFYGEIVNFKREGKGIMTYPDGDLYEGSYYLSVDLSYSQI